MQLTVNDAISILGISRATLYRKLRSGELKDLSIISLLEYSYQKGYHDGLVAGQHKMYQQLKEQGKIRRRRLIQ